MSSAGCPSLSYSAFRPTLHMRAATRLLSKLPVYTVISTRAPRAGSDTSGIVTQSSGTKFQSTLPVRGATGQPCTGSCRHRHFNPRSPCGERLAVLLLYTIYIDISIHAPRAGSDDFVKCCHFNFLQFQSTLPVRGATSCGKILQLLRSYFNPRSPCGERLRQSVVVLRNCEYFNPRSPCGERR